MAENVNADRINRWKCLICGSKHKKIINHYRESDGKQIGYTLFCCNCGHVDHFAWTVNAARNMCGEDNHVIGRSDVKCGLYEKDLVNCEFLECPYRPEQKPKGPSKTVNTSIAEPEIIPKSKELEEPRFDEIKIRPEIKTITPKPVIPPNIERSMMSKPIPPLPGQVGAPYIPPHGNIQSPTFASPDPIRGPERPITDSNFHGPVRNPIPPKPEKKPDILGNRGLNESENFTIPVINGQNNTGKL